MNQITPITQSERIEIGPSNGYPLNLFPDLAEEVLSYLPSGDIASVALVNRAAYHFVVSDQIRDGFFRGTYLSPDAIPTGRPWLSYVNCERNAALAFAPQYCSFLGSQVEGRKVFTCMSIWNSLIALRSDYNVSARRPGHRALHGYGSCWKCRDLQDFHLFDRRTGREFSAVRLQQVPLSTTNDDGYSTATDLSWQVFDGKLFRFRRDTNNVPRSSTGHALERGYAEITRIDPSTGAEEEVIVRSSANGLYWSGIDRLGRLTYAEQPEETSQNPIVVVLDVRSGTELARVELPTQSCGGTSSLERFWLDGDSVVWRAWENNHLRVSRASFLPGDPVFHYPPIDLSRLTGCARSAIYRTPSGSLVAGLQGYQGKIMVLNLESGEVLNDFPRMMRRKFAMLWNNFVVTGDMQGVVEFWRIGELVDQPACRFIPQVPCKLADLSNQDRSTTPLDFFMAIMDGALIVLRKNDDRPNGWLDSHSLITGQHIGSVDLPASMTSLNYHDGCLCISLSDGRAMVFSNPELNPQPVPEPSPDQDSTTPSSTRCNVCLGLVLVSLSLLALGYLVKRIASRRSFAAV